MSLKALGIFELKNPMTIREEVEFAFFVTEVATKHKIGIQLGAHVFEGFLEDCEKSPTKMPFELTDDPLDVNAECLFIGDGVTFHIGDVRVDTGEPLKSRMLRVQNFLSSVFASGLVNKIILEIDNQFSPEYTIDVKVDNFSNSLLKFYEQEDNFISFVRVIITP